MANPTDRAIAQAFRELGAGNSEQAILWRRIEQRAHAIDSALFTAFNHRECPSCHCKSLLTDAPAHIEGCREATRIDVATPEGAQGAVEERLVYVPGMWRCAKCEFTLIQSNLNSITGSITARNDTGDKCPNCACGLWRVTYRDAYAELMNRFEEHITTHPPADAEDAALVRECLHVAVGDDPSDWEDADGVPIGPFLVPAVNGDMETARKELARYRAAIDSDCDVGSET